MSLLFALLSCTEYNIYNYKDSGSINPDSDLPPTDSTPTDTDTNTDTNSHTNLCTPLEPDMFLSSAYATMTGVNNEEHAGTKVWPAGDMNKDGYGDILISALGNATMPVSTYLKYGTMSGPSSLSTADAIFEGEIAGSTRTILGTGDFDNDGWIDIVVGDLGTSDSITADGKIYIVNGPVSGAISLADAAVQIQSEAADKEVGSAFTIADFTGDGKDDLVFSAPREGRDQNPNSYGAIYLISDVPNYTSLANADLSIRSDAATYANGQSVNAADVNGDGLEDLLVAGGISRDATVWDKTFLFPGPLLTSGTLSDADVEIVRYNSGGSGGAGLTKAIGIGDINNDGYDDFAIGVPQFRLTSDRAADRGAVYVFLGDMNSGTYNIVNAYTTYQGMNPAEQTGADVAGAGDVNGDGNADFLIGVPYSGVDYDAGYTGPGKTHLFYGPISSGTHDIDTASDVRFTGNSPNDNSGWSVAPAGDVDDDGFSDILIGAPGVDADAVNNGAGYVFLGCDKK